MTQIEHYLVAIPSRPCPAGKHNRHQQMSNVPSSLIELFQAVSIKSKWLVTSTLLTSIMSAVKLAMRIPHVATNAASNAANATFGLRSTTSRSYILSTATAAMYVEPSVKIAVMPVSVTVIRARHALHAQSCAKAFARIREPTASALSHVVLAFNRFAHPAVLIPNARFHAMLHATTIPATSVVPNFWPAVISVSA